MELYSLSCHQVQDFELWDTFKVLFKSSLIISIHDYELVSFKPQWSIDIFVVGVESALRGQINKVLYLKNDFLVQTILHQIEVCPCIFFFFFLSYPAFYAPHF